MRAIHLRARRMDSSQNQNPAARRAPGATLALYALAIFLSSAALMALEIAAARLLAPYIGVSLYSWTAIIGVILAGLSLGNWLGGSWADRGGGQRAAGVTLVAGAIACLAILLLLTLVATPLQNSAMGLLPLSFLFAAVLFFVPAALLGVVTPLLTTLALRADTRTGHVVGMLHAVAALGSIAGTFLSGYVLIQYVGTHGIILGIAALLGVLALPLLGRARWTVALSALLAAGTVAWTAQRGGFVTYCDRETSYFCIRVVDMSEEAPFGQARGLVLDHLVHGINHRERPELLISSYTQLMGELIRVQADRTGATPLRVFFAGGGAYTQPRALRATRPDARIVVAELDPVVTDVARQMLYYEPVPDEVIHGDARRVLARMPAGDFDVIVGDVFHDVSVPYHLVTREYAALVRSRLRPDGVYLMNVVDAHPDPRLVKSIMKTLRREFPHVQAWLEEWPDEPVRMTYVLAASQTGPLPAIVEARRGFPRGWQDVSRRLLSSGIPDPDLPVMVDDLVPVERLLSPLLLGSLGR